MISELFDMFKRTHEAIGNIEENRKDFKIIVKLMLSDFGSSLYVYMLMLKRDGRKIEEKMVFNHREMIFAIRDSYDKGQFNEQQVVEGLTPILEKILVQKEMLCTVDERQWEAEVFKTLTNDMTNFLFYMKNRGSFLI